MCCELLTQDISLLSQWLVKEVGPALLGCRGASVRRWDVANQRVPRSLKGAGRLKPGPTSSRNFSDRTLASKNHIDSGEK